MADQKGDSIAGVHTTATRLGVANAVRLFQFIALSMVVITIVIWYLGLVPNRFLYAMVPCSLPPLVGIGCLLIKRATDDNMLLAVRVIKVIHFCSLIPGVLLK